ncbi:MocR-like pyridoxine biosynthesis transcription factor PdxR [Hymenobacter cellulosilyticus]|uniref:PLP-dependent aminotransferase family protein n=1 Tax=Hymenobacter cellulosilyticus TaxID=2932248 RepID=A0A8T9Q0C9_9BACT|nr:PLP-dependent aminotransferase family protein [Hymenobacter cellulosilyticus]UOQ71226.1 PLP-dependent aminotransferase family protein [Hymenobacter cellulosilyticus]
MLPYATLLPLNRHTPTPLSQQLTIGLIHLMQQGLLAAGDPLPGTRTLAGLLGVHRQTVVVAFDELEAQGWIEQRSSKAARVSSRLPTVTPQPFQPEAARRIAPRAAFSYPKFRPSSPPRHVSSLPLTLSSTPDSRLAPLAALARKYRALCLQPARRHLLGYAEANGSLALRQQLAEHLRATRGLPAQPENVAITRGGTMSLYLLAQLLLQPGDAVVVGQRSYHGADRAFSAQGTRLHRVGVDAQGLCIDELAALCQRQAVRLVYVTPHHHYPTTVTLSAERRVRLLQLAAQHDFIILEDDYDFDFHYDGAPILPLASTDRTGRVLYMGSLSKVLAPAFRVGYVVAPADVVEELGHWQRRIDRQGDTVLEQGIAELFAEGEMNTHLKRARLAYHQRRDVFCQLLREQLPAWFTSEAPTGGLAVWGRFADRVDLTQVAWQCQQRGLGISDGQLYQTAAEARASHVRLGFAALNCDELTQSVGILSQVLQSLYP